MIMASKRDKLKRLNQVTEAAPKEKPTTIVDELVESYERAEEESKQKAPEVPEIKPPIANHCHRQIESWKTENRHLQANIIKTQD